MITTYPSPHIVLVLDFLPSLTPWGAHTIPFPEQNVPRLLFLYTPFLPLAAFTQSTFSGQVNSDVAVPSKPITPSSARSFLLPLHLGWTSAWPSPHAASLLAPRASPPFLGAESWSLDILFLKMRIE